MQQSERHCHLTDEQCARKVRQAIDSVGITDCNAATCYDCILPYFASIDEANAGVPPSISTLCARTLHQLEYYTSKAQGQGATDAPAKLTFINSMITKAFNKRAKGCILKDPTGTMSIQQKSVKYVDENSLLYNSAQFNTPAAALMEEV
eukprot:11501763-Ditylum_brightwellii.AAC.1